MDAWSVTSSSRTARRTPCSRAAASSGPALARLRMVATTVWPCLARWSAVAKPMPVLVPVTSVTGMGAMLSRGARGVKRGDLAAVAQVSNWHKLPVGASRHDRSASKADIRDKAKRLALGRLPSPRTLTEWPTAEGLGTKTRAPAASSRPRPLAWALSWPCSSWWVISTVFWYASWDRTGSEPITKGVVGAAPLVANASGSHASMVPSTRRCNALPSS